MSRRFATASLDLVLVGDKRNIAEQRDSLGTDRLARLDHVVFTGQRVLLIQTAVERSTHVIGDWNGEWAEVANPVGLKFK